MNCPGPLDERAPLNSYSLNVTPTRFVISANSLRQATEPMTARDITLGMFVTRALDKDDQKPPSTGR